MYGMNELLDPDAMYIITMVMMLSLNLMFNEETFASFKTFFIRRTRANVFAIMCELGNESKNYYRIIIWMLKLFTITIRDNALLHSNL